LQQIDAGLVDWSLREPASVGPRSDQLAEKPDIRPDVQVGVRHDPGPSVALVRLGRLAPKIIAVALIAQAKVRTEAREAGAGRVEGNELVGLERIAGSSGRVAKVVVILAVAGVREGRRAGRTNRS
jgi:hypothetical protein